MKKVRVCPVLLLMLALSVLVASSPATAPSVAVSGSEIHDGSPAPQENFTIVALPDTQHYVVEHRFAEIFDAQTEWVVNNISEWNIVFVTHEGDIVEHGGNESEWQDAQHSMRILDNKVPYGFCCGNHDYDFIESETPHRGEANLMAAYFPSDYYEDFDYWGGSYWDDKNNYQLISACEMDFLMLHVEYDPPEDVLAWASSVLDNYPDRYAILTTHSFLCGTKGRNPEGEKIWNNLVLPHKNVQIVLCGHETGAYAARRSDLTPDGRIVHQIFANYQGVENGGNGWLRLMTFVPEEGKVHIKTYSPHLDQYMNGDDQCFVLSTPHIRKPPAGFVVENLSIGPEEVEPGEEVTISADVTNIIETAMTYTVDLSVNGEVVDSKSGTLEAGGSETVLFTVSRNFYYQGLKKEGTYCVSVDGETGSFRVVEPEVEPEEEEGEEALPIPVICVIIVVVIISIALVCVRRKR